MRRRPLTSAATVLGLALLVLCAPAQWRTTLPLWLALLPGLVVRALRAWRRYAQERRGSGVTRTRLIGATMQRRAASYTSWIGPAFMAATFVGLVI